MPDGNFKTTIVIRHVIKGWVCCKNKTHFTRSFTKELNVHVKKYHKTFKPFNKFRVNENKCEFDNNCIYNYVILHDIQLICFKCGNIQPTKSGKMNHIKQEHGSTQCHKFQQNKTETTFE